MTPTPFLNASHHIDHDHPDVRARALSLASGCTDELARVRSCFEFVRDQIKHSWDHRLNPVTCRASDVLRHGTGYCYAKSHLLAALLRANGIPAGLSYQRLSVGDEAGPPYCLHGLNAVYLSGSGWLRLDARGNKPGVNAQFDPPRESLAFHVRAPQECDLPGVWAEPHPAVIEVLTHCDDVAQVHARLPDVSPSEWVSTMHALCPPASGEAPARLSRLSR